MLIRWEILDEETSPRNQTPTKSGTQHSVIQISRLSFLSFLQTISNQNYFASCSLYRTRANSSQAYLVISYSHCNQKASRANYLTQREKPKLRVGLLCIFDDRGEPRQQRLEGSLEMGAERRRSSIEKSQASAFEFACSEEGWGGGRAVIRERRRGGESISSSLLRWPVVFGRNGRCDQTDVVTFIFQKNGAHVHILKT